MTLYLLRRVWAIGLLLISSSSWFTFVKLHLLVQTVLLRALLKSFSRALYWMFWWQSLCFSEIRLKIKRTIKLIDIKFFYPLSLSLKNKSRAQSHNALSAFLAKMRFWYQNHPCNTGHLKSVKCTSCSHINYYQQKCEGPKCISEAK